MLRYMDLLKTLKIKYSTVNLGETVDSKNYFKTVNKDKETIILHS